MMVLDFFQFQGLFSATQTDELEALVRAGLRNPVRVTVREKHASNKVSFWKLPKYLGSNSVASDYTAIALYAQSSVENIFSVVLLLNIISRSILVNRFDVIWIFHVWTMHQRKLFQ